MSESQSSPEELKVNHDSDTKYVTPQDKSSEMSDPQRAIYDSLRNIGLSHEDAMNELNKESMVTSKPSLEEYLQAQEKRQPNPKLDVIDPPMSRRDFAYFRINQEDESIEQKTGRYLESIFACPDGRVVTVTAPKNSYDGWNVDIGTPNGDLLTSIPISKEMPIMRLRDGGTTTIPLEYGTISYQFINGKRGKPHVLGIDNVEFAKSNDYMIQESSDGVRVWKMPSEESVNENG